MAFAVNNGLRLWFETQGEQGTPVVLIMGLGGRGVFWEPQIEALRPHHEVLYFDNRGIGKSDQPDGGATMVELASDVVALMNHKGWETAHIIGVSMGGMIAQEVALQYRHRVRSLSLIATTSVGIRGGFSTPGALPILLASFVGPKKTRRLAAGRILFPKTYLKEESHRIFKRIFRRKFNPMITVKGLLAQINAVMFHYTENRLYQLKGLPTLVVWGEEDILITPKESRRLVERIPGVKIISFENAGHGLNWQCEQGVNRALLEHLWAADEALKLANAESKKPTHLKAC